MKTFYIDFCGWCQIKADTEEQARTEFWRMVQEDLPLPESIYHIDGTEEKEIEEYD